ncbi:dentin sialophosphoprotein-like isoform X1 [Callorhinchus milii]|uniref:dentin sialophosphoprotein-like isoform X1 n=1 Tax=Callorhinchus milii TaxID=7868 RepID=UPI00045735F7|nr:dentin sialophosphoprotein-like isoform X1 [Callorhinchus milii]|eukprot:gi/632952472/ref/XP_007891870.1/ PREDICTED: dentin sialophosphoprotein-like isoform X1 [Callorhinchus milii]
MCSFICLQDKNVAVTLMILPLTKAEIMNQTRVTEDWDFEVEDEELGSLQCEGADKQYYHLYWDEESLTDRSNNSVLERTDLNKRKLAHIMDSPERGEPYSALQSSSSSLCLQESDGSQSDSSVQRFQQINQLDSDKLESNTTKGIHSTTQLPQFSKLSTSPDSASGSKASETNIDLKLSLSSDKEKQCGSGRQVISSIGISPDGNGSLCFDNLKHSEDQIRQRVSDLETSMDNTCILTPQRTIKCSTMPLCSSQCTEQDDTSSGTDELSSTPSFLTQSSRFTSGEEFSGSDESVLSFLNDSSSSESSCKDREERDSVNSTYIARMTTGLVNTNLKPDTLLSALNSQHTLRMLDSSREVAGGNSQNRLMEPDGNLPIMSGSPTLSSSRASRERNRFYDAEFHNKGQLHPSRNILVNLLYKRNSVENLEESGEPVKRKLDNMHGWKPLNSGISANPSDSESPQKLQDVTVWQTRSVQQPLPEFEQGKVFERPPVPNAENFTEHIELEIQETVDHNRDRPEVIRARRVTPPTSWIENKTNDDALQSEKLHSSD